MCSPYLRSAGGINDSCCCNRHFFRQRADALLVLGVDYPSTGKELCGISAKGFLIWGYVGGAISGCCENMGMRNTAAAPDFGLSEGSENQRILGSPVGSDAVAVLAAEKTLSTVAGLVSIDPANFSADALLTYTSLIGNITRFLESRQASNVGDIASPSDTDAGFECLVARHGSASPMALFEKVTGG